MSKLLISQGDITQLAVDIIVNAANQRLLGGGGVDGAIHASGGPSIMLECDQIRARQGGCVTGQAVITSAGNLPAKHVIHTVGPIYSGRDEQSAQLLADCYVNSLVLANKFAATSISFPNISTGVYGYPKIEAAGIALTSVKHFLNTTNSTIRQVNFVCFDSENFDIYNQLIDKGNFSTQAS